MPFFEVRDAIDVYDLRRAIRALARAIGFPVGQCQELEIVVSELCTNIVKYGVRGSVQMERVHDFVNGEGIAIAACDVGPPFRNLELALRDGYDDRGPIDPALLLKRGGLGTGLGAVWRFTDSFDLEQAADGKCIRVRRFLKRPLKRLSGA